MIKNVEIDADCSPLSITPQREAPTTTAEGIEGND
jgi:hypothetical protein